LPGNCEEAEDTAVSIFEILLDIPPTRVGIGLISLDYTLNLYPGEAEDYAQIGVMTAYEIVNPGGAG
jgi:hypothetical protein